MPKTINGMTFDEFLDAPVKASGATIGGMSIDEFLDSPGVKSLGLQGMPAPTETPGVYERAGPRSTLPLEYLPMAGAMATAPFTGGMSLIPAAAATGLGAATGEAARQMMEQATGQGPDTSTEAAKRIGMEFALGAASEIVPRGAGKMLKLTALGSMTPEAKGALKVAKEMKLPISDTAFYNTRRARAFEWVVGLMPGGRGAQKLYQRQVADKLTGIVDTMNQGLGAGKPSLETTGALVGSIREALAGAEYSTINKALDEMGTISLANTNAYLSQFNRAKFLSSAGWSGQTEDAKLIRQFLRELSNNQGQIPGSDLRKVLPKLWKRGGYKLSSSEKAISGLKDALLADMDQIVVGSKIPRPAVGPPQPYTVGDIKRTSDQIFGESAEWLKQQPIIKAIGQDMRKVSERGFEYWESNPMETLQMVFDPRRTDQALAIRELLKKNGQETFFYTAYAKKLSGRIEKEAFKLNPNTQKPELDVGKLSAIFDDEAPFLKKVMPDVYANFQKVAMMDKFAAKELRHTFTRDQIAKYTTGASLAGMAYDPVTTMTVNATAAGLAWSVTGRSWLSRAIKAAPGLAARGAGVKYGTDALTMGGQPVSIQPGQGYAQ